MTKIIMTADEMDKAMSRMAFEILEKNSDKDELCLIGIQRRGVNISKILKTKLERLIKTENTNIKNINMGILDITFYRDDLSLIADYPVINGTDINFSLDKKNIILVDDVLYTGRTIRAAIDGVFEYGRPSSVSLAVLIDRGNRELPFKADFVGKDVPTSKKEVIKVMIKELDGKNQVEIVQNTKL